jgi:hypothetical protein
LKLLLRLPATVGGTDSVIEYAADEELPTESRLLDMLDFGMSLGSLYSHDYGFRLKFEGKL